MGVPIMQSYVENQKRVLQQQEFEQRWCALLYVLLHHDRCKELGSIIDIGNRRLHVTGVERKLRDRAWSPEDKRLLRVAIELYVKVDHYTLTFLNSRHRAVMQTGLAIREGLITFEDAIQGRTSDGQGSGVAGGDSSCVKYQDAAYQSL